MLAICAAAVGAGVAIVFATGVAKATSDGAEIAGATRSDPSAMAKAGWRDALVGIRVDSHASFHGDCLIIRVERSKRHPGIAEQTESWPCGAPPPSSRAGRPAGAEVSLD